jgi:hypothetical protein
LWGSNTVALPGLVHDAYGRGAWLFGLFNAAEPVASLLALVLAGQAGRLKRTGLILCGLPWSTSDLAC